MGRKLVSGAEAVEAPVQHKKPCSDCPWSRDSLPGWLGSDTAEDWRAMAHGETKVFCHCISNQQCAGIAIYRANVCKAPRDSSQLKLPSDHKAVFSTPNEFMEHHK